MIVIYVSGQALTTLVWGLAACVGLVSWAMRGRWA